MKLVFMGTPDYAVASLRAVHAAGHDVRAVVTQPPRPRGRGRAVQPSPVEKAARELGIDALTPEKPNRRAAVDEIAGHEPEIILAVAYGVILRERLLSLPPRGCVNAHGSLLPRHRGAAPIAAAIRAGDPATGVTLIRMVRQLDAGPMLLEREVPVDPRETAGTLHDKLATLSAELFVEYLRRIEDGEQISGEPQDDARSTYAPLLSKADGRIDWSLPADLIDRHIRAMSPWPGAFTSLPDGTILKVHLAEPVAVADESPSGAVVATKLADEFAVATGSGHILLRRVQLPGKKLVHGRDFLRGHRIDAGTILGGGSDG